MLPVKYAKPFWGDELKDPKLRFVSKISSAYPLNDFPTKFSMRLGVELIYHIATNQPPAIEGKVWEKIFADCIDAKWEPSNVGLDDIILQQTAWSAKTVISSDPFTEDRVRLISGRNSISYSFGKSDHHSEKPEAIGQMVLEIWNRRVEEVRARFRDLRTVVLLKSKDFKEFAVFEHETFRYDWTMYDWAWNKKNNLEGRDLKTKLLSVTWQPHGSQLTFSKSVPEKRARIRLKKSPTVGRDPILKAIGFDPKWIEVLS